MTVSELIAILSEHDAKITVLVDGFEDGLEDLFAQNIRVIRYVENISEKSYRGPHDADPDGDKIALVFHREGSA